MKKFIPVLLLPLFAVLVSCTPVVDPSFPVIQPTPVPGSIWTVASRAADFEGRYMHASVVFDNAMWVLGGGKNGGALNDVWFSMDGTYWQESTPAAAFGQRQGHSCVVFNNKMWVIGGYTGALCHNDVWYSENGVDWAPATKNAEFAPRTGQSCVVYDSGTGVKMYIIGGHNATDYFNDVWYSEDGIVWYEKTHAAEFSARYSHTSVVFDNTIWVIGGVSYISGNYVYQNDVWKMTNGNWDRVTPAAAFEGRFLHASVVYDDKIWVIDGSNNSGSYYTDAWYSANGADWKAATRNSSFSAREGAKAVVYNNTIFITGGGINAFSYYYNDVWRTP